MSRAQLEANLHAKRGDPAFRVDIHPLLRPHTGWDFDEAMDLVLEQLVAQLPGDPWKGAVNGVGPHAEARR